MSTHLAENLAECILSLHFGLSFEMQYCPPPKAVGFHKSQFGKEAAYLVCSLLVKSAHQKMASNARLKMTCLGL